jgi:hypothetical protein
VKESTMPIQVGLFVKSPSLKLSMICDLANCPKMQKHKIKIALETLVIDETG